MKKKIHAQKQILSTENNILCSIDFQNVQEIEADDHVF